MSDPVGRVAWAGRAVQVAVGLVIAACATGVMGLASVAHAQTSPADAPQRRPASSGESGAVLVLGDSIMAWNADRGVSVTDVVEAVAGVPTVSAAVPGSRVLGGADAVPDQYQPGPWSWVLVQGGGNDLVEGCGCGACDEQLDRLLGADGATGALAELVARIRADGPKVVLWSYYEMPDGAPFPFGRCNDELVEIRTRLARLAERDDGIVLVDGREVVDPARLVLYDRDRVHPSPAGSRAIGKQLAKVVAPVR